MEGKKILRIANNTEARTLRPSGSGGIPEYLRRRLRFWPAATMRPSMFTFSMPRRWDLRSPCSVFASANRGSTQTWRFLIARVQAAVSW